jgi:cell division protein FtsI (penicillin-binding protein 3)
LLNRASLVSKRAAIISTAVFFGFILVMVRLADLMLLNHERLAERAKEQYQATKDLRVGRGKIYDRRGRALAVNVDVLSAYCNPREIESPENAARVFAKVTGEKYGEVLKKIKSRKGFVWLRRKLDMAAASELEKMGLKGIGFVPEFKRHYPKGYLASHLVGFVGVDNQPLEGIELSYDESLRGWEESVPVERDAVGRTLSEGIEHQNWGNSVVLTIDEGLQYVVERALDRAIATWGATSATAVMMNPFTGEVLAMANRPTYDLNEPTSSSVSSRRNRAITDSYEPGSTFKLITAAAALEEGAVTTDMKFDTSAGFIRVGRKAIWDITNHGIATFAEVIRKSSNVGTVMVGQLMDEETLYKYVKAFGFGSRTGIDLEGESSGKIKPPKEWSGTTQGAVSIGYEVAVTPLQLLRAYSAVANGGLMVTPHVVSRVISPEGRLIYDFGSSKSERVISARTSDILREILVSVTQLGGTGPEASVDGNRVAGKTGTTRLIDPETGTYSRERYASSFVGFVPAEGPRVALIVVVFEPKGEYYGGQVAAPVFREIAEQALGYLNVPREDDFREGVLFVRKAGY